MLVKELIEMLQNQNPEAEALIMDVDGYCEYDVLQVDNDGDMTVYLFAEI